MGRKYFLRRPTSQYQKFTFCPNWPWKKTVRKFCPAPFLPLLAKIGAVRPLKFFRQKKFFIKPFELFCRIFGLLTTVVRTPINEQCYQLFCLFDLTHDRLGGGGGVGGDYGVYAVLVSCITSCWYCYHCSHTNKGKKRKQKNKNKTLIHRSIHALVVP